MNKFEQIVPEENADKRDNFDPSKPIGPDNGGENRYRHGGVTQEERERSATEAAVRLSKDQAARRKYLLDNLSVDSRIEDMWELRKLTMESAGGEEREKIFNKIQQVQKEQKERKDKRL